MTHSSHRLGKLGQKYLAAEKEALLRERPIVESLLQRGGGAADEED